jgi:hypothetical protein
MPATADNAVMEALATSFHTPKWRNSQQQMLSRCSLNLMTRRSVLQKCVASGVISVVPMRLAALMLEIIPGRPSPSDRRFSSAAIEMAIADVKRQIADPMLSAMFERCFPNTLDTTVFPGTLVLGFDLALRMRIS